MSRYGLAVIACLLIAGGLNGSQTSVGPVATASASSTLGLPESAFEAALQKELSYDDGTAVQYESWPVSHCGWGVKFDADTSPVYVESLKVFLSTPTNVDYCGYQLAVFLDDGTGKPGKLYSRTPVQYATAGTEAWNSVFLAGVGEQLVMPDGQFYVFYLQGGEPPECPVLGLDAARNPLASYWRDRNGVMIPDSTPGDFMIRAVVSTSPVTPAPVDLRTLYVDQPLYDFVQRPFDEPITPKGRVENFGSQTVAPVSVRCDIIGPGSVLYYTNTQTLASLAPGQDTLVAFANWVPTRAERDSVVITTLVSGGPDPVPQNDEKRSAVDVLKGAHTGVSPLHYAWIDSDTTGGPTYAWIDTTGCQKVALDDNLAINIPFEPGMHFPYYGVDTFAFVYVSANGWVALGATNPGGDLDTVPDKLPTTTEPNRCVYAWWDDLAQRNVSGHGMIYYRRFGTEPNRYMVIIFQDVNRVGTDTANGITFELIFRENGTITCQYRDVETGDLSFDNGKNASIGLENKDGTDGLNYLYARPPMSTGVNDPANRLSAGRAIMFTPTTPGVAEEQTAPASGLRLATITNPVRGALHLSYNLPQAVYVSVRVCDPTGTCVSRLADGIQQPGRHDLTWARTDSRGQPVPTGIYFCILTADGQRFSRKLVLTE